MRYRIGAVRFLQPTRSRVTKREMKTNAAKTVSAGVLLLIAYASLAIFWLGLGLPTGEELVSRIREWFDAYGYPVVLISSFLEALLLIGLYYPGSFVIFIGVILAKTPAQAAAVVALVSIGFLAAALVNYALGKYGWYRLLVRFGLTEALARAKERVERHAFKALVTSTAIPNFLALTATAAGILFFPFARFLLFVIPAIILWNTLWGTIVYLLGDAALVLLGGKAILFAILSVLAVEFLFRMRRRQLHGSDTKSSPPTEA